MAEEKYIEVGGRLHSIATGNVLAYANEVFDDGKDMKQSVINAETDAALEDRYTKGQTYSKSELNNMITTPNQEYVSVTATAQTTAVTDLLPPTGEADTVYRVGNWDGSQFDASVYSEYAWNGSQYVHLSTKTKIGEVFDISAYHATGGTLAKYADLTAALDGGNNIPQSLRKGGMNVKFVRNSDNKYVQYRLMSDSFNTTPTNWQGVDDKPTAGSSNLVESGGVKEAISVKKTQNLNLGGGTPYLANSYIASNGNISTASAFKVYYFPCTRGDKFTIAISGLSSTVARLYAVYRGEPSDFSSSTLIEVSSATLADSGDYVVEIINDDATYFAIGYKSTIPSITASKTELVSMADELEKKVDKEIGKGLSTNDYTNNDKALVGKNSIEDSQEYMQTTTDNNGNVIEDITVSGKKEIHVPTSICGTTMSNNDDDDFVNTETDVNGNIISAVDKKGKVHLPVPTDQDDILAGRVSDLETKFIDIKSDNFDYHEECIFHDNFCRNISNVDRPWDIGSNSSAEHLDKYDYISLYDTDIDDGFRIDDGPESEYSSDKRLVNYKQVAGRKGFRLIKNLVNNNNIVAVIENPTENNKYEAIAFNVKDVNNYELFKVHRVSTNGVIGTMFIEHIVCVDGVESVTPLNISANAYGNAIRFYFVNDSCKIFLDDNPIYEGKISNALDNIGLFIEPTQDYSYHFFNIYYISDELTVMDTSQSVDRGVFNNGITQHHGQIEELDASNEYAYHLVSGVVDFGRCEKFEIRYAAGLDGKSDREENGFYPPHLPMLCKYRMSFDVMFPSDFVGDNAVETIWQQHASITDGVSPCVAFHVKKSEKDNSKWAIYFVARSYDNPQDHIEHNYESETEICFVEPGKWRHFDIFIKSGYIPEHNPVSVIKIDNVKVFNVMCPNAYNVAKPDYLRYGLYKPIWMTQETDTNKRVLYFDNFKVTY